MRIYIVQPNDSVDEIASSQNVSAQSIIYDNQLVYPYALVQIAISRGADILFDETSQAPYFNYVLDGLTHEVWFEDVRSLTAKFNLVKEYGLRGMSYWQIMQLFRANWLLLNDTFTIR